MDKLTEKDFKKLKQSYAYSKALNYMKNWFDFDNPIFKNLTHLNIEKPLDFHKVRYFKKILTLMLIRQLYLMKFLILIKINMSVSLIKVAKLLNYKKFPNLHRIVECIFICSYS